MDGYLLVLHGDASRYDLLLGEPEAIRATTEARVATSSNDFKLHAMWPHGGGLHLVLDGNGDPDDVGRLLAERLGPGWAMSVVDGLRPATISDVEAGGRQNDLVGAVDPELRRCELCGNTVLPHREDCPFQQADEGDAEFRRIQEVDAGPSAELEDAERSRDTVPA